MVIALEPLSLNPDSSLTFVELAAAGEASALVVCSNQRVLSELDFDVAFWTVSDAGRVEKSLWLVGHAANKKLSSGWRALAVKAPRAAKPTLDAESLAAHQGYIYVLGSCFGAKRGPLARKRAFMARFRERDVGSPADAPRVPVEVAREPFMLHRLINDGLRSARIELMPVGPHVRRAYIERTLAKAALRRKSWCADVRVDDWPLNIEGMEFLDDHVVVLGMRYPVTSEGHPILVVLDGRPGFFGEPGAARAVSGVVVLSGVGSRGRPAGVRAVSRVGSELHVLTGPVAASGKGGALSWDHPGSLDAGVEHWSLPASWLSVSADGSGHPRVFVVEPRRVHSFEQGLSVEGLARLPSGRWCYVIDREARIVLALT